MRRRSARDREAGSTLPSKRISPRSVRSSPTRARASVDLPDPDSPTRASASPRRISRSTPSTARSRRSSPRNRAPTREPTGNDTETSRAESSGSAGTTAVVSFSGAVMAGPDLPRRPPACVRSAGRRWTARGTPGSGRSGVSLVRQSSSTNAHRGWNRQPDGGLTRLGGEPGIGTSDSLTYSKSGAERTSPSVYGWRGSSRTSRTSPRSTSCPPYMTATSRQTWATTGRS